MYSFLLHYMHINWNPSFLRGYTSAWLGIFFLGKSVWPPCMTVDVFRTILPIFCFDPPNAANTRNNTLLGISYNYSKRHFYSRWPTHAVSNLEYRLAFSFSRLTASLFCSVLSTFTIGVLMAHEQWHIWNI